MTDSNEVKIISMVDDSETKLAKIKMAGNNEIKTEVTTEQNPSDNTMREVETAPILTKTEFAFEESNDNSGKAKKNK